MMLIPKRFNRSNSKVSIDGGNSGCKAVSEVKWEVRPGGMLVQKRDDGGSISEENIRVRVSMSSKWHDISIEATSTFGELKTILSVVTKLKPTEQRLLFKGKEREDGDYLHMVGVGDMDKVLLLEDPSVVEKKLNASHRKQAIGKTTRSIRGLKFELPLQHLHY